MNMSSYPCTRHRIYIDCSRSTIEFHQNVGFWSQSECRNKIQNHENASHYLPHHFQKGQDDSAKLHHIYRRQCRYNHRWCCACFAFYTAVSMHIAMRRPKIRPDLTSTSASMVRQRVRTTLSIFSLRAFSALNYHGLNEWVSFEKVRKL